LKESPPPAEIDVAYTVDEEMNFFITVYPIDGEPVGQYEWEYWIEGEPIPDWKRWFY